MITVAKGSVVERLFLKGAHFAQARSRRHPSMKPFIVGAKARIEILDLEKTMNQLEAAKNAMSALGKEGKTVLFVGGKPEIANAIREAAKGIGAPYVAGRWLGGTISNFAEIKKRIDRLSSLLEKRESGELEKSHTKLERVKLDREIARLSGRLEGITALAKRPDALVIVDTRHEAHATKEARGAGLAVIGILGSDCNVKDAAYPIVANDASREAVEFILRELVASYAAGKTA